MAGKKGSKLMTVAMFNHIKLLQTNGVPDKYIVSMTGFSKATLYYIKRAENFDEYKEITAVVWERKKKATAPEVLPQPTPETTAGSVEIGPILAQLQRQETKLGNIESLLSNLLGAIDEKSSRANVNFWKRP